MAKERTVTIELDYPVQLPDGELKRLVMHRPSVKEVMDNPIRDALDIAGESRLYAVLCGIGVEDIQALDMEDYGKLQQQFMRFRGAAVPGNGPANRPATQLSDRWPLSELTALTWEELRQWLEEALALQAEINAAGR